MTYPPPLAGPTRTVSAAGALAQRRISSTARRPTAGRGVRLAIRVVIELALALVVLAVVLPLAWMLVLSVQPARDIIAPDFSFSFTLSNFRYLFEPGKPYLAQFGNSLAIVAGTVALCLAVGTLTGYALSHLYVPRWITRALLALAGFLALVPPMVLVPGLYVVLTDVRLIGGVGGLVLLNTVFQLPFSVLLMKVYFDRLPSSLREAAIIDGASEARTFWSVMLPLVRPGIAAVAVFVGIMAWDEFLFGLTMTSGGTTAPLTVGIAALINPDQVVWGQLASAGALAAVPMIILAWAANRHLVAGLTRGATKG